MPKRRPLEALNGERTFNETRELLEDAIRTKIGASKLDGDPYLYVQDASSSAAIYCFGDDLFEIAYSVDAAGAVTIDGEPTKVEQETNYVPATESRSLSDRISGRLLGALGTNDAGGRIYGVQIIAYGNSKNRRSYPESVMRKAAPLYEGAKAYDHHRTDVELATSTIEGLVGSYRKVEPNVEGLQAELHLLPSATHTAEALDASLAAVTNGLPPLVGISHDVQALFRPVVSAGDRRMEATEITSVNSADVVADPAAGGRATRMVAGGIGDDSQEKSTMTLEELLALLDSASPEQRAAALGSLGISEDKLKALAEAEPVAEPIVEPVADAEKDELAEKVLVAVGEAMKMEKASPRARATARAALGEASLDERLVESILSELPERVSEAEIVSRVRTVQSVAEGLEKVGLSPKVPDVQVTKDELDGKIAALDAMLAGTYRGAEGVVAYRSLKHAFADITGIRDDFSTDYNRVILRESLGERPFDGSVRSQESVSSSTWNLILGDSITRRAVAEYQDPESQSWRTVAATVPVNDFRTQRIDRMGGYGLLPDVNQGAAYQALTSPGNEEASYAITKRGGTEDLTLETIANDDLRAVQRIPKKLGLSAAQTLFRFVWDLFDANATCSYDSVALFHSSHANTATSALSQTALSAIRKKMRDQAAYGASTQVLGITPKFLIVNNTLEELAFQLCTSAVAIPATPAGAANTPNLHQGLQPIVVDYWTSTTKWYLAADAGRVPMIEVGFYQGREEPELFVQSDPTVGSAFTSDKITYKIRHIYSGAIVDHRGLQRGNT